MKKVLISVFAVLFFTVSAFAEPYEAFNFVLDSIYYNLGPEAGKGIAKKYLEILASDVGQAIAGGSYGVGGELGLIGLNLSLKVSYQQVADDNLIVRTAGDSAIYYPIVQAEYGILERLDFIGRISYMSESFLIGGGARYRLHEGYYLLEPTVSVQSVYNYLTANVKGGNKFDAWNLKNSVTASFLEVPYVKPYVFVTYDITGIKARSSKYSGLTANAFGFGYGGGLSALIDRINVTFTISMYNDQPNYNFGVFIAI